MSHRHAAAHEVGRRRWPRFLLAGGLLVHTLHFLGPLLAGGWLANRGHAHHRGTLGLALALGPLLLGGAALAWPHLRRRVQVCLW